MKRIALFTAMIFLATIASTAFAGGPTITHDSEMSWGTIGVRIPIRNGGYVELHLGSIAADGGYAYGGYPGAGPYGNGAYGNPYGSPYGYGYGRPALVPIAFWTDDVDDIAVQIRNSDGMVIGTATVRGCTEIIPVVWLPPGNYTRILMNAGDGGWPLNVHRIPVQQWKTLPDGYRVAEMIHVSVYGVPKCQQ